MKVGDAQARVFREVADREAVEHELEAAKTILQQVRRQRDALRRHVQPESGASWSSSGTGAGPRLKPACR